MQQPSHNLPEQPPTCLMRATRSTAAAVLLFVWLLFIGMRRHHPQPQPPVWGNTRRQCMHAKWQNRRSVGLTSPSSSSSSSSRQQRPTGHANAASALPAAVSPACSTGLAAPSRQGSPGGTGRTHARGAAFDSLNCTALGLVRSSLP
ncbi:hypothetical protein PLESTB_001383900 [Pleodorina starrii]|uniref:Uncharacterized protein n=1 Tax=Pleodorina starrii TaxID=330485 RepID=A0A9W6BUD8_9CHLO|nr:hypothetical protein PLESTB_001260500 [Pleodorina starrii]GLC58646.1 hypothetical protein PLESTB_001383900 [Pleodorina starrii]